MMMRAMTSKRAGRPGTATGALAGTLALIGGALVLAPLWAFAFTPAASRAGGELADAKVELRNGKVLQGALRPIQPSLFLVQTDESLYEISADEIASVNGQAGPPRLATPTDRLIRYETYEVVTPQGDVERWINFWSTNDSRAVWTYIRWGANSRELEMYRTMEAYDGYQHRLTHRVEPRPGTELYDVTLDLAVPIAPGEQVNITERFLLPQVVKRKGNLLTFTFGGDFPEDRICQRKVQLPVGATIESVKPEPLLQFVHAGSPVVVWRRYYPREVEFPLTVTYRLPGEARAEER